MARLELISAHVRALREGDDATKTEAVLALRQIASAVNLITSFANRVAIVEAGGIPPLVQLLRDGNAEAIEAAAWALNILAMTVGNEVLIADAGGISPLVDLLRDGIARAKEWAAAALGRLANNNAANKALIADEGGIPLFLDVFRDKRGPFESAKRALRNLAINNDANAVAIAAAVGLEAFVELAQRGSVTVFETSVQDNVTVFETSFLDNAGVAAKRKAALVVAALLGDCVPDSARGRVPYDVNAAIVSFL